MVNKDGMILEKQHRRAVTSFPFREGFLSPVRGTERVVKPIVAWLGCGIGMLMIVGIRKVRGSKILRTT